MNNRILKTALIISLAFNLAVFGTLAWGWAFHARTDKVTTGRDRYSPESYRKHCAGLSKHLGLSREKAKQLEEAVLVNCPRENEIRTKLVAARAEFLDLLRVDKPDEGLIMGKVEEISSLRGELEKLAVQRLRSSCSILDSDENGKLLELIHCRMKSESCENVKCSRKLSNERVEKEAEKGEQ
ncbi:MAG: periplasmic heavy metal sensor [Candidatus Krumholzibacteriota bacterium]|nr:periplasmic heavy metal sensor [Candidatus Krumholzibacteriota bacterium]